MATEIIRTVQINSKRQINKSPRSDYAKDFSKNSFEKRHSPAIIVRSPLHSIGLAEERPV